MRLLFIGLDGLGLTRAERYLLANLPDALRWGELSAEPGDLCNTGPSWTSIFTGQPAAEHGITSLVGTPKDGSKVFRDLPGQYLFEQLPGTTGCMNIPTTYPPRARSGDWMISGYPFQPVSTPANLLNGLDYVSDYAKAVNLQRADRGESWFWPDENELQQAFTIMHMIEEIRLSTLRRLPAVDNLFVANCMYDRGGHLCHDLDEHEQTEPLNYAAKRVADWALRVIARFPAQTTVLCSDHGWSQAENRHAPGGFYAMFGAGVEPVRVDLKNYELKAVIEDALLATDPDVHERMEALGYV